MKHRSTTFFLFLLLSVFTFNLAVDCVAYHKEDTSSYVCELNEAEELNEIGSRLRSSERPDLIQVNFHFCFIKDMLTETETSVSELFGSSAFFPNALHVPIYKGKCVFLI